MEQGRKSAAAWAACQALETWIEDERDAAVVEGVVTVLVGAWLFRVQTDGAQSLPETLRYFYEHLTPAIVHRYLQEYVEA